MSSTTWIRITPLCIAFALALEPAHAAGPASSDAAAEASASTQADEIV